MKIISVISGLLIAIGGLNSHAKICTVAEVDPITTKLIPLLGLEASYKIKSTSFVDSKSVEATGETLSTYKVTIAPPTNADEFNTFFMYIDLTDSNPKQCSLRSLSGNYGAE